VVFGIWSFPTEMRRECRTDAPYTVVTLDFSRIRQADLDRFTLDRLVTIAGRLGAKVRLTVRHPRVTSRRQIKAPSLDAILEKQKQVRLARGKLRWTGDLEEMRRD